MDIKQIKVFHHSDIKPQMLLLDVSSQQATVLKGETGDSQMSQEVLSAMENTFTSVRYFHIHYTFALQ